MQRRTTLCSLALLTILASWPAVCRPAAAAEAGPAVEPRPVLVVPARAATLHIAIDLPASDKIRAGSRTESYSSRSA